VEAFPWDTAPRYMIRDRDKIYGLKFRSRIKGMGIKNVKIAFRSPWHLGTCPWRISRYAATGSSNKPRQWDCHR
jgi:hypothetical protein